LTEAEAIKQAQEGDHNTERIKEPSSGLGLTELPAALWILYRRQLLSNVCLYRRYIAKH